MNKSLVLIFSNNELSLNLNLNMKTMTLELGCLKVPTSLKKSKLSNKMND